MTFLQALILPLLLILIPFILSIISFFVFPCCSCVRCGNAGRCCKYKAPPKHVWPKITCIVFLTLGGIFAVGGCALGIWGVFDMIEFAPVDGVKAVAPMADTLVGTVGSVLKTGDELIGAYVETADGDLLLLSSFWDANTRSDLPGQVEALLADKTLETPIIPPLAKLVSDAALTVFGALELPDVPAEDASKYPYLNYTAGFTETQDQVADMMAPLVRAGYDAAEALRGDQEPTVSVSAFDGIRPEFEGLTEFVSNVEGFKPYAPYMQYIRDFAPYILTSAGVRKLEAGQPLLKSDIALSSGPMGLVTNALERLLSDGGIDVPVSKLTKSPVSVILGLASAVAEGIDEAALEEMLKPFSSLIPADMLPTISSALDQAHTYLEPFHEYLLACSEKDEQDSIKCTRTIVNGVLGLPAVKDFLNGTPVPKYVQTFVDKYGLFVDLVKRFGGMLAGVSFKDVYGIIMGRRKISTLLDKFLWDAKPYLPCAVGEVLFGPQNACPMTDQGYESLCRPEDEFVWDLTTPVVVSGDTEVPENVYVGLNLERAVYSAMPSLTSASFVLESGDVVLPLALGIFFFLMPLLIVSILLCSFCCRCTCCATFSLCFTCYSPFVISIYSMIFLAVSLALYNYGCKDLINPLFQSPSSGFSDILESYGAICTSIANMEGTSACPTAPYTFTLDLNVGGILYAEPNELTFDLRPNALSSLDDILSSLYIDIYIDLDKAADALLTALNVTTNIPFNFGTIVIPIHGEDMSIDNLLAHTEPTKDLFASLGLGPAIEALEELPARLLEPFQDPAGPGFQIFYSYLAPLATQLGDLADTARGNITSGLEQLEDVGPELDELVDLDVSPIMDLYSTDEALPDDFSNHLLKQGQDNFASVYSFDNPKLDYMEVFYSRIVLEALELAKLDPDAQAGLEEAGEAVRLAIQVMADGNKTYDARDALYEATKKITGIAVPKVCLDALWSITSETSSMGLCEPLVSARVMTLDPTCLTDTASCVQKYKTFFVDIAQTAVTEDQSSFDKSFKMGMDAAYIIDFYYLLLENFNHIITELRDGLKGVQADPVNNYLTGLVANVEYAVAGPADYEYESTEGMLVREQPSYPLRDFLQNDVLAIGPDSESFAQTVIEDLVWSPLLGAITSLTSDGPISPLLISSVYQTPRNMVCDGPLTLADNLAAGLFFTFVGLYTVLVGSYCIHPYIYQAWMKKKGRLYPSQAGDQYDDEYSDDDASRAPASRASRPPKKSRRQYAEEPEYDDTPQVVASPDAIPEYPAGSEVPPYPALSDGAQGEYSNAESSATRSSHRTHHRHHHHHH